MAPLSDHKAGGWFCDEKEVKVAVVFGSVADVGRWFPRFSFLVSARKARFNEGLHPGWLLSEALGSMGGQIGGSEGPRVPWFLSGLLAGFLTAIRFLRTLSCFSWGSSFRGF